MTRFNVIGDSQLSMGYFSRTTSASSGVVVSGGIATFTTSGGHNCAVGNYAYLINRGDPTYANSLNGACVKILSAVSNTVFTVSATFNGQTMADGDYSTLGGTQWTVMPLAYQTDSSHFNWLRAMNKDPFIVTSLNAMVGQTSGELLTLLPKILAGPTFDAAIINIGTNDCQLSTAATAVSKAYYVFNNIVTIASAILAQGKQVYIATANADNIGNSNTVPKAEALAILRRLLWNWSANKNVTIIDTFAHSIDGTNTSGQTISGYIRASTDVHLSTLGDYNVCKQESGIITNFPAFIDTQPVSLIEDQANFAQIATAWVGSTSYSVGDVRSNGFNVYICTSAGTSASSGGPTGTSTAILDGSAAWNFVAVMSANIVSHGLMDGTGGTNNTAGAYTTNVPTGWTLANSGGSGTTTPASTRTAIGSTNSASWGKGWQLSCVFTAGSQTLTASQDLISRLTKGGWYRFGITLTALNTWGTLVNGLSFYLNGGGGSSAFQPTCIFPGNNSTTFPFVANDTFQYKNVFYVDSAANYTQMIMTFVIQSAAAGTVNFELASAFCEPIIDPTSY